MEIKIHKQTITNVQIIMSINFDLDFHTPVHLQE